MNRVKEDKVMENIMKKKITFERIPELTEEEQDLLDSIKRGLKEIQEGKGMPIEEVLKRIKEDGTIDWEDWWYNNYGN